jgi:hypothetical protein
VFDRCTDTNFQIQGLNSKKKTDDDNGSITITTSQGPKLQSIVLLLTINVATNV